MNDIQSALLYQALSYGAVMLITILVFSFLLRGFLWKYIKVRISLGKYVLIKCRSTIRDYFYVGWIEDGFLVFKDNKNNQSYQARISIDNTVKNPFYKCMGVLWIDINEEKSAVCNVDYSPVSGYDNKKYSDLMVRCLQQPILLSNTEKIIIGLCILIALLGIANVVLSFYGYDMLTFIKGQLPTICKGVVEAIPQGGK